MCLKSPTTYQEQINILRDRGCVIEDPVQCENALKRINYYRLSAYFLPFTKKDGNYITGTSFLQVCRIYDFDQKLRHILFLAIEELEVFLRSQLAYYHAHKYGALGYLDKANYNKSHNHPQFIAHIQEEIHKNSKVLFVKHHLSKYHGQFPIWVIIELFTFGMLSHFFADLPLQDQKCLSRNLFHTTFQNLRSWLQCCSVLRNICAHYGRLYYRIFNAVPRALPSDYSSNSRSLFVAMKTLKDLYPDRHRWNDEILIQIQALVEQYKDDIHLSHIGFSENWAQVMRK